MQPPTADQLQCINELVLTICEKVAESSAMSLEHMRRLPSARLTAIASDGQAATVINTLEADAARSKHFFKVCCSIVNTCGWMAFCKGKADTAGAPFDNRVTPARVMACLQGLLEDASLKTLKTTRCVCIARWHAPPHNPCARSAQSLTPHPPQRGLHQAPLVVCWR